MRTLGLLRSKIEVQIRSGPGLPQNWDHLHGCDFGGKSTCTRRLLCLVDLEEPAVIDVVAEGSRSFQEHSKRRHGFFHWHSHRAQRLFVVFGVRLSAPTTSERRRPLRWVPELAQRISHVEACHADGRFSFGPHTRRQDREYMADKNNSETKKEKQFTITTDEDGTWTDERTFRTPSVAGRDV